MATLEQLFPGHYSPSEEDLTVLWREGTFVLDANVLLQLYSLPETTRQETITALQGLRQRLWMPYQVAVEYQRNRIRSIGQARDRVAKVIGPLHEALGRFEVVVGEVQLEKRGMQAASEKMMQLLAAGKSIIGDAELALASQVDLVGPDPIRDEIGRLFADRIGGAPTQVQLDAWYGEAKERYKHKMGPGYEDGSKKDPTFRHGSQVYNKLYGDYVLWRQTIEYAAALPGVRNLVMLTQDKKPDWWLKHNDRLSGPHPELVAEILAEGQLQRFWMYDLEEFLQTARNRLHVKVSDTTLSDVKGAGDLPAKEFLTRLHRFRAGRSARSATESNKGDELRSMGIEPLIYGSYYSVGKAGEDSWAVVTTLNGIAQFASTGAFRELMHVLHDRGANNVHFYCITDEAATEFEKVAYSGFIRMVTDGPTELGVTIFFYYSKEDGAFDILQVQAF